MKLESEPISDDEWLLRRVHVTRFRTDASPLSPDAFTPRTTGDDIDSNGISLFRESCQQSAEDILRLVTPEKKADNGIVKIRVSDLKALNMSVVSDPIPEIPGHVVIPELNAQDYLDDKKKFLLVKRQLAELADMNILRPPQSQKNWGV